MRCGAGARCAGTLTVTDTVRTTDRRGTHTRTVVLGRARFSVAPLHGATVRLYLARLAVTLLRGHQHIRVRAAAAVTNAAAGQASVARSVWLAPAPEPHR